MSLVTGILFRPLTYIALFLAAGMLILTKPVKGSLKSAFRSHLILAGTQCGAAMFDAAYVLGGSPGSLYLKFRKAASLYNKGKFRRVLVPHRSGITHYYPRFKRNLKNDEWSIMKLTQLGIPKSHIDIVQIDEGFFGTYSEAKTISAIIRQRGYKSLLLITAPFHTKRTKLSFQNFLDPGVRLAVVGTTEKAGLVELTSEAIKLLVYKFFLVLEDRHNKKSLIPTGLTG